MTIDALSTLIDEIRHGDTDAASRTLRAEPALVNAFDEKCFGATPLIHAVGCNNRAMVDLLLESGADINLRSDWWAGSFGVLDSASDELSAHLLRRGATLTPHAAARLGMIDELRRMLDADPPIVNARGGDGQLPLHFARTPEIAGLLLERGAQIDAVDIDHASTAAQWLATSRPEVVNFLVSRGARSDPFMLAMIGDIVRLAEAVKREPDGPNVRMSRERFPAAAPAAGHIYVYTIGEGCSPLHAVAKGHAVESARWLLANGADPNARGGYDDQTPLHAAAWHDAVEVAPVLIAGGADINARSGSIHNNQPLGWAIVGGSVGMVRLLLEAGAIVQPNHREEAIAGAKGAFRQYAGHRPLASWAEIAELIAAAPRRPSPG